MMRGIYRPFQLCAQVTPRETSTQPATAQMHSTTTWSPQRGKMCPKRDKCLALTSF